MPSSSGKTSSAIWNEGEDHFTAAQKGTNEIGLAVLATTFSIIAVFVPVAYMKGIVGRFFFQFGITVAFAVLVSLFVSFTLDPMLSSRWFDPDIERRGDGIFCPGCWIISITGLTAWPTDTGLVIAWALDHRKSVFVITTLSFSGGLALFFSLQSSFFPTFDAGEFQVEFQNRPGCLHRGKPGTGGSRAGRP